MSFRDVGESVQRALHPEPSPLPRALEPLISLLGARLVPIRVFAAGMMYFRAWWPVLIPAVLVFFGRAYRRERRRIVERAVEIIREEQARTAPPEARPGRES